MAALSGLQSCVRALGPGRKRKRSVGGGVLAAPWREHVWAPIVTARENQHARPLSFAPPLSLPWAAVPGVESQHVWCYAENGEEGDVPLVPVHSMLQSHITAKWTWRSWWLREGATRSSRGVGVAPGQLEHTHVTMSRESASEAGDGGTVAFPQRRDRIDPVCTFWVCRGQEVSAPERPCRGSKAVCCELTFTHDTSEVWPMLRCVSVFSNALPEFL